MTDRGTGTTQDDGYGILAVDDYWIVVLPHACASFATREEAEAWLKANDE